jgi:formate-dependent nitrite reductase membrane component NrfD
VSRILDLRRIIAYLFLLYGIILVITGALASPAALHKAQNVRINLWTGLGMLVVGLMFLIWELARPLPAPDRPTADRPDADGPHAP